MSGKRNVAGIGAALLLLAADGLVWQGIMSARSSEPVFTALDVGQGDATLLALPGGIHVLVDAGPDRKVLKALRATDPDLRRIDLAIITHPELDHFNGFNALFEEYAVGAIIMNGRNGSAEPEWQSLLQRIGTAEVPLINLKAGDSIVVGSSRMDVLSPDPVLLQSAALNDTGLVLMTKTPDWTALLTADIGMDVESGLLSGPDMRADILKVGHHGSKYSTGRPLLAIVRPRVAVLGSGKGNRYGHPAPETLERLSASGAFVFRTDTDGNIVIRRKGQKLEIVTSRLSTSLH